MIAAGLSPDLSQAKWAVVDGELRLHIPAGDDPLRFTLWMSDGDVQGTGAPIDLPPVDLSNLTHGGPACWPQTLETQGVLGPDDGPFAVDVLGLPVNNPWSFAPAEPVPKLSRRGGRAIPVRVRSPATSACKNTTATAWSTSRKFQYARCRHGSA